MEGGRIAVRPATDAEIPRLRPFTFPAYEAEWAPDTRHVAVAAFSDSEPVGLALAIVHASSQRADLLSLFVAGAFRRRGIGRSLMARLEALLTGRRVPVMTGSWAEGGPSIPALERLLVGCGWMPPAPRMLMFQADLDRLRAARWVRQAELPPEFSLVSWTEVHASDRLALERWQQDEPWIP